MRNTVCQLWVGLLATVLATAVATAARAEQPATLPAFDFTRDAEAARWKPVHDIKSARPTAEGLAIDVTGSDPYLAGPVVDFPAGVPMRLHARINAGQGGTGQLYWFRGPAREQDSARFAVKGGDWQEVTADVPALGRGYALRFDPPGNGGTVTLAKLWFEPFAPLPVPEWPKPVKPQPTADSPSVKSGDMELRHDGRAFGSFELRVAGQPMAAGLSPCKVGYTAGGAVRWVDVSAKVTAARSGDALDEAVEFRDPDGATWRVGRSFKAAEKVPGAIDARVTVEVDQDRDVVFLPLLVLLPGAGSFGDHKKQAVFPGLEYLDDEPSSSEADVTGPAAHRLLPDPVKITFPMMTIAAQDRYVGLSWSPDEGEAATQAAAIFDSPDRTFGSGGHVMGLVFPGYDRESRVDGHLMPVKPTTLKAKQPLVRTATIFGGSGGASVVPALQHYVKLRGLPPVPPVTGEKVAQAYFALAAHGWMDSAVREGDRYRHAVPGNFAPHPAADAALLQDWLAGQVKDRGLAGRLRTVAGPAIAAVDPNAYDAAAVGHIRYPVQSLVYGHVAENVDRAAAAGRALVGKFEPDGTYSYKSDAGKPNYGRTHFAPDANGLTATHVATLLEHAAVSGDPDLIRDGLRLLRAMDKFRDAVPRGAQTWECPLHIPDVLAAAKLVRAYTVGYELAGDPAFLESAKYWAWTGVPFVYLDNPTDGPIGPYMSTSVFGATQWTAPVWMGQPVQWTALVYADALYRLLPHDPAGPWRQLADGIAASGVQQTFPRGGDWPQYAGLLPDSFLPREQHRIEPAINPATVLMPAVSLYRKPAVYSFHAFRDLGVLVHAPGPLAAVKQDKAGVSFRVDGWPEHDYYLLVSGLKRPPGVRVDGKDVELRGPNQYVEGKGRLILKLDDHPVVEVRP